MSEILVVSDPDWDAEKHGKSLCDRFGEVLAKAYPGYRWRVNAKPEQGIVDIVCEHANTAGKLVNEQLRGSRVMGYTFNLRQLGMPDDRQIRAAGGEILERYNLGRRGFSEDAYRSITRWCGQLTPEL